MYTANLIHVYRSLDGTKTFRCSVRGIDTLSIVSDNGFMILVDDEKATSTAILRRNYKTEQSAIAAGKNFCELRGIKPAQLWTIDNKITDL